MEPATGRPDHTSLGIDPVELFDQAPCGYLTMTPDGVIVRANETFARLTGHAVADLVGRRAFSDLLSVGGRIYHETHYVPMLLMQGSTREIALDIVCADGRRLPTLVNSTLTRDESGAPRAIHTVVFDATERRGYERELVAAKERAEASEARATALADTLQQTLIPPTPPTIPGLDVRATYRPAGDGFQVGGDFYDVFQIGPDDWMVAVGDVCGKGIEAAVVTSLARHTLRAAAMRHERPSEVLASLNSTLLTRNGTRHCTVGLAHLRRDTDGWRVGYSSGGHPLPLLRSASGGARPVGSPGTLLGILEQVQLTDVELRLRTGDSLVLFTDGVTEARRGQEWYGVDGLTRSLLRAPATAEGESGDHAELPQRLLADVLAFQDGLPRDDIVIVTVTPTERAD